MVGRMSVVEKFGHFFKPEVRRQGAESAKKGSVVLSLVSDTRIEGHVRGTSPAKIVFSAASVASAVFSVTCTCAPSSRGQLCRHLWAALLLLESKHPDFLESKRDLEKDDSLVEKSQAKPKARSEAQAEYRKKQYARLKEQKKASRQTSRKAPVHTPEYPAHVQKALSYFAENGFPVDGEISIEYLSVAKKKLSRVFHPDKGGTHEEMLDLNRNFEVLASWVGSK
jgi:hypothetical protein